VGVTIESYGKLEISYINVDKGDLIIKYHYWFWKYIKTLNSHPNVSYIKGIKFNMQKISEHCLNSSSGKGRGLIALLG
jgi:hypothetical protein